MRRYFHRIHIFLLHNLIHLDEKELNCALDRASCLHIVSCEVTIDAGNYEDFAISVAICHRFTLSKRTAIFVVPSQVAMFFRTQQFEQCSEVSAVTLDQYRCFQAV